MPSLTPPTAVSPSFPGSFFHPSHETDGDVASPASADRGLPALHDCRIQQLRPQPIDSISDRSEQVLSPLTGLEVIILCE